MSGDLERRYRRLLILLPKEYREERGEEVLGALLDGAEEHGGTRRWPDPREVLSLAALALRVRAGADAAVEASRKAEAARLIALCGAFYLAVNGIGWLVGNDVWLGGLFKPTYVSGSGRAVPSVVQSVHMEGQALWGAVYVALAAGMWWTGRVLAVVGACFSLATTVLPAFAFWDTPLMVVVAVAACATPARRPTRGQRRARLAAALPLLYIGIWTGIGVLPRTHEWMRWWPDRSPSWITTATLIAVAAAACVWHRASATWLAAVTVVGLQPVLVRIDDMAHGGSLDWAGETQWIWLSEICLVAVLALRLVLDRRTRDRDTAVPA